MERIERIAEIIKEKGVNAQVVRVRKGDEVKIGISMGDGQIRPTIYPQLEGVTDEEAAEQVIRIYEEQKAKDIQFDVEKFMDYEQMKSSLIICLRQPTSEECTDIKRAWFDMEMYIRAITDINLEEMSTVTLRPEHMKMWEVSEDELFNTAIENTKHRTYIRPLKEVMLERAPKEEREFIEACIGTIPDDNYIVSNREMQYGASAFLDIETIKAIADKHESDVYIIPSSVHEILLYVDNAGMTLEDINEMVRSTNESCVEPNERLSNHAYKYHRASGMIY